MEVEMLRVLHCGDKLSSFYPVMQDGHIQNFEHVESLIDFACGKFLIEENVQKRGVGNILGLGLVDDDFKFDMDALKE